MPQETPDTTKQGRRHLILWSVAGAALGLLLAAGAWWIVGGKVWTDVARAARAGLAHEPARGAVDAAQAPRRVI